MGDWALGEEGNRAVIIDDSTINHSRAGRRRRVPLRSLVIPLAAAVVCAVGTVPSAFAEITTLLPPGSTLNVQSLEVIKIRNDANLADLATTDSPPLRVDLPRYHDIGAGGGGGTFFLANTPDLCITTPDFDNLAAYGGELEVTLRDESGDSVTLTYILEQGGGGNETDCRDPAPPARGENYPLQRAVDEDTPLFIPSADLLAVVYDPNGTGTVELGEVSIPPGTGSLTPTSGGYQFQPLPNQTGRVTISYEAADEDGSALFQAHIDIAPVNDFPEAEGSTCLVGPQGGPCQLVYNDVDHSLSQLSFNLISPPSAGAVTNFNAATRQITYEPASIATEDSFTYNVNDPADGTSETVTVMITITDDPQDPSAVIQLTDANGNPIVNPAAIDDTDGAPGETLQLDGSASLPGIPQAAIIAWHWTVNGQPLAAQTSVVTVDLPDGQSTIELIVEDDLERRSAPATLQANVLGRPNSQIDVRILVNGTEVTSQVTIDNEDFEPGETVLFDGSQSFDPEEDPIVEYVWTVNDEEVQRGASPTASLALEDGPNIVTLTVFDALGGEGNRTITVTVAADPDLGTLPGLSPGERAMGSAISNLCPRLDEMPSLTDGQRELLNRCSDILNDGDSNRQRQALDALTPEEITSQQTTGIDFSTSQLANLGSRLATLRQGGGGGVNIAGLSLRDSEGRVIPLQHLAAFAKHLAGGASGDDESAIAASRWGIFVNGNIIDGEKDETAREAAYDFGGWGITAGFDYRLNERFVLGLAVGYNESDTDFARDAGGLDSNGISSSVYGTYFTENLYVDFIGTTGALDYDSVRHIVYQDAGGTVDETAVGKTEGDLAALGVSFGYDFHRGGWTFGPTLALTNIEVDVDPFAETGAGGLDLQFDAQSAESRTVQGGFQFGYALSRPWGVLQPQMRVSFVRELENESQIVNVRFVHDPFVNDPSQPSPGTMTILTDEPDENYVRWGVGLTFVRPNGVSAFVDYEGLAGLASISSGELTLGLRIERSFR